MRKKILMVILTFSVLILPGFVAAEALEGLLVLSASHSVNVSTAVAVPEDEKDCAQHLAELLDEGMAIVETSSLEDARAEANLQPQLTLVASWAAAFHLANASSQNPKAAIIVCQKEVEGSE